MNCEEIRSCLSACKSLVEEEEEGKKEEEEEEEERRTVENLLIYQWRRQGN